MSISEQVKELREYSNISLYTRESRARELLKEAADTIEALYTKLADMERSAEVCGGGWIPCENKMPEIGKPVLVCDKQGNVCIRAITCKIKGKKYWSQDKYDVVAWRPLPEPYHEP